MFVEGQRVFNLGHVCQCFVLKLLLVNRENILFLSWQLMQMRWEFNMFIGWIEEAVSMVLDEWVMKWLEYMKLMVYDRSIERDGQGKGNKASMSFTANSNSIPNIRGQNLIRFDTEFWSCTGNLLCPQMHFTEYPLTETAAKFLSTGMMRLTLWGLVGFFWGSK